MRAPACVCGRRDEGSSACAKTASWVLAPDGLPVSRSALDRRSGPSQVDRGLCGVVAGVYSLSLPSKLRLPGGLPLSEGDKVGLRISVSLDRSMSHPLSIATWKSSSSSAALLSSSSARASTLSSLKRRSGKDAPVPCHDQRPARAALGDVACTSVLERARKAEGCPFRPPRREMRGGGGSRPACDEPRLDTFPREFVSSDLRAVADMGREGGLK